MKNILIAGASRGLGYELAKDIINYQDYSHIFLWSKNPSEEMEKLEATDYFSGCISGRFLVNQSISYIEKIYGPVTHLVVTAGIYGPIGKFHENDLMKWQDAIDNNLFGPANLCHRIIPNMIKNNYGKIVLLSGGGATHPMPAFSAYSASKCGLVRFAETIAEEYRENHIDINCVAPGMMNTRFNEQALAAGPEIIGEKFYYDCKEIENDVETFDDSIKLINFLLSEKSNDISGKLISARYDNWDLETDITFNEYIRKYAPKDKFTLRRID